MVIDGLAIDWTIPVVSIVAAGAAVLGSLWVVAHRDQNIKDYGRRLANLEPTVRDTAERLAHIEGQLETLISHVIRKQ